MNDLFVKALKNRSTANFELLFVRDILGPVHSVEDLVLAFFQYIINCVKTVVIANTRKHIDNIKRY